ncbi:unnamed protein product [Ostreobium quekettii]|uniref:Uncharacterized protein n=1 Tax=Ostreobium quekettii TaxID=121088 RepID=A0A8S1IRW7_9CHLO|nr:unnamed protein product [Ostreobium quekettii]
MFRTVFGRATASAAAAGAAGTAAAGTGQAHAHARPVRIYAAGTLVDERADNPGLKIEEDWQVPQLQGEEILFSTDEIDQTIQEITSIATGRVKICTSDNDSVEADALDNDVNAVIDQTNVVPANQGMQQLGKMTNIMLNRPSIQREILQAFQQEPELRSMINSLSTQQGCDAALGFSQRAALAPAVDPCVEDVTDGQPRHFLHALVHDIAHGLEMAGAGVARAGQQVGNFLGRLGRWLRGAGDAASRSDASNAEKILGLTMCFAMIVMAVLVAKRVGFVQVASRR